MSSITSSAVRSIPAALSFSSILRRYVIATTHANRWHLILLSVQCLIGRIATRSSSLLSPESFRGSLPANDQGRPPQSRTWSSPLSVMIIFFPSIARLRCTLITSLRKLIDKPSDVCENSTTYRPPGMCAKIRSLESRQKTFSLLLIVSK